VFEHNKNSFLSVDWGMVSVPVVAGETFVQSVAQSDSVDLGIVGRANQIEHEGNLRTGKKLVVHIKSLRSLDDRITYLLQKFHIASYGFSVAGIPAVY